MKDHHENLSNLIYFDFRKFVFANEDQTNLMFASY